MFYVYTYIHIYRLNWNCTPKVLHRWFIRQLSRVVVTSLGPEVGPWKINRSSTSLSFWGVDIFGTWGVPQISVSQLQPEFCRAGQCTGQFVYLGLRVVCLEVWKLSLSRWGFGNPGRWVVYHIYIVIATESSAITQLSWNSAIFVSRVSKIGRLQNALVVVGWNIMKCKKLCGFNCPFLMLTDIGMILLRRGAWCYRIAGFGVDYSYSLRKTQW